MIAVQHLYTDMLFNSYEFIFLFLPVTLIGFFGIARTSNRLAALWLAAASLFFYGWWSPQYVLLLLLSITINYASGYFIGHRRKGRDNQKSTDMPILIIAIGANLALLGYFKYANFFLATTNDLAGTSWLLANIILPCGISFYTFTQIAFLVDVYRGIVREYDFIHYALFVTYFPHLIAGPVLHHKQMMPQFTLPGTYHPTWENIGIGLTFFCIGLAKKVLLADNLGTFATPIFGAARDGSTILFFSSWIGTTAYAFQLYFDFSGYSDMAVGLSKMFGINLPYNFNSPYKSRNIIEFWQRWHMTLSQFLRDYLYIPLGGNRKGLLRRYTNLVITMTLGGLWHGANWTFVAWGGLHGGYLVINHAWRHFFPGQPGLVGRIASVIVTYLAVLIAWVFFRAESFSAATSIIQGMIGMNGISLPVSLAHLAPYITSSPWALSFNGITPEIGTLISTTSVAFWLVFSSIIVWAMPNTQELIPLIKNLSVRRLDMTAGALGCLFCAAVFAFNKISEFLYFQF